MVVLQGRSEFTEMLGNHPLETINVYGRKKTRKQSAGDIYGGRLLPQNKGSLMFPLPTLVSLTFEHWLVITGDWRRLPEEYRSRRRCEEAEAEVQRRRSGPRCASS